MSSASILLTALTLIGGIITCARSGEFEHFRDTDEFTLRSRGILRNIVQLSEENGIKRILCKDNVILVAMTNLSYTDTWSAGDIVVGGAEWGCVMTDREAGKDNHVEFGFHRIIDSLEVKANKRVDIYTRPAGLFDLFLEANIFYQHRTLEPVVMSQDSEHQHARKKRSVVPWKATSEDIPIEYDVTVKESFPSAGKVVYDDGSINTTKSFYEVRMLLDQVDFHQHFQQILPINYNPDGENSRGYFGFRNGEFVYNSSYFDETESEATHQKDATTEQNWEILCEDCFIYYLPEVTFELEIDQLVGVKRYSLQLSGPFETNINLAGSASGEMSILLDEVFHRAPEHLWISIPLVEDIDMFLTPKFNVTMDAHLDMKVTGPGQFQLGYDHVGNLTILREWTQEGHTQEYVFEPEGSVREHGRRVDVAGELFYNVSMMTAVIDLKADIFWKLPKNIFGFYLTSPMQIRIEPNVLSRSILDADQVACVEAEAYVLSAIYLEDIIYDTELLGQKYDFLILPDQDNNTFYMMMPEAVVQAREICKIRCYGPEVTDKPLQDANTTTQIVRGGPDFESLTQLLGDLILFAPEADAGVMWCGLEGRPCLECTTDIVGKDVNERCSTRLVSRNIAVNLDQLAHWVVEDWKQQELKLHVIEAWNEPNSQYPDGKYGDDSLYYEGRAVKISLMEDPTKQSSQKSPTKSDLVRLSQLAVCAGFPYVELHEDYVELGVDPDEPFTSDDHQKFIEFFQNAPPQTMDFCDDYSEYFPELSLGESVPSDTTAEEALGGIDSRILRHNEGDFLSRLFYYPFDNVDFLCEEVAADWCGSPIRDCMECNTGAISGYAWSRCADRVMTPRLAAKLFHLADMVQLHPLLSSERLVVQEAWDEPTSAHPEGLHPEGSLHYEGRAVQLSLTSVTPAKLAALTSVALCAGFDAVHYASENHIQASVKNQEGYFTVYAQFLEGQILQVLNPPFYELEYGYPEEYLSESRITDLFDGDGENGEIFLSSHFQVKEFTCPLRRYARINKKLVECLQWTRDFIQEPIEILSAYKPRSYNLENFGDRHAMEMYRFQSGHAAEIRITGYEEPRVLTQLATAVLKSCSAVLRLEQHTLGVGLHRDRVYIHVKISSMEELDNWLEVWNVDGDPEQFQQVDDMRTALMTDGPPIVPQSWDTACDIPDLGYDKYYYQVQIRPSCRDKSLEFCQQSSQARKELVTSLKEQMHPILGFTDGPLFEKNPDVDNCFLNLCGSCNGAGSIWQKKLVACSNMLWSIKHLLYREVKVNQTAFFNTDNTESTVHGIACRNGKVCLENTQVYSVFAPVIMSSYRPDSGKAMEVRLYEGTNNPSPIIDLVEQEMAFRAKGTVHVYVEYERDLSALKKVVKVLMAYNKDVTEIQFHLNTTVFQDHVYERIQDWIDVWRYDVCPLWSRATLAPFTVDVIPEEQVAYGMKDSQVRNALQREVRNRDLAWIMKM